MFEQKKKKRRKEYSQTKELHQLHVSAAACGFSERMLRHVYRQPDDGASSEVDDVVDRDHLQVQHQHLRPFDGPRQDEGGAHVAGLLQREERGEECED